MKSNVKPKRGFTIDRRVWLRGEPHGSRLYRPADRKQCCVGIYLRACGVSTRALSDQATAASLVEDGRAQMPSRAKWLLSGDYALSWAESSVDGQRLYGMNDSPEETGREERIEAIFARHGEAVRFIGPKRKAAPKR